MSATATERVRVSVSEHVATVTLSRPEKHNALDQAMFEGILTVAERLRSEAGVRAVVLHGAGPSFCSGIDLVSLTSSDRGLDVITDELSGPVPNRFQRVAHDWLELEMPVIAALHGSCFGGGLQIALGADIRIAAPDTRLSLMEVKWGLVPDMALTRSLPRLVGIDVAKELAFTGRVIDAAEADRLGLVTHLAEDPLSAAQELAGQIAAKSPDAVRAAKRLFEASWTAPGAETLALEASLQRDLIGSPNQLESVRAGLAKETPAFVDPSAG